jgi:hypothetical protein
VAAQKRDDAQPATLSALLGSCGSASHQLWKASDGIATCIQTAQTVPSMTRSLVGILMLYRSGPAALPRAFPRPRSSGWSVAYAVGRVVSVSVHLPQLGDGSSHCRRTRSLGSRAYALELWISLHAPVVDGHFAACLLISPSGGTLLIVLTCFEQCSISTP